jgi:hypothetical protein
LQIIINEYYLCNDKIKSYINLDFAIVFLDTSESMFFDQSERLKIGRYLVKTSEAKFELSTAAVPAEIPLGRPPEFCQRELVANVDRKYA